MVELMEKAGVPEGPHRTPKGLCHGFGINAVQSGVPAKKVQKWIGHSTMDIVAVYSQATGADERKLVEMMW